MLYIYIYIYIYSYISNANKTRRIMNKIKVIIPIFIIAILAAFSVNLADTEDAYALGSYMTVTYICPSSGEKIDRCDWGHSGCVLSVQLICVSKYCTSMC